MEVKRFTSTTRPVRPVPAFAQLAQCSSPGARNTGLALGAVGPAKSYRARGTWYVVRGPVVVVRGPVVVVRAPGTEHRCTLSGDDCPRVAVPVPISGSLLKRVRFRV